MSQPVEVDKTALQTCVRQTLEQYLNSLQGQPPQQMYDMLLHMVQKPLLELVMERSRGNQSRAALWLGINRNTLRSLLQEHGMHHRSRYF